MTTTLLLLSIALQLTSIMTNSADGFPPTRATSGGDLEEPPIESTMPFGNTGVEIRKYKTVKWACYTPPANLVDPAPNDMFFPLFHYISGKNNVEDKTIPMTRPVIVFHEAELDAGYASRKMCFLIGSANQEAPPTPTSDSRITVESIDIGTVITRTATKRMRTPTEWADELAGLMADIAAVGPSVANDPKFADYVIPDGSKSWPTAFTSAGYNSPFETENLRSEIWLRV